MQDNDFSAGLQQIFAANLVISRDFQSWFLARTKFRPLWPLARLLHDEQQASRGQESWWGGWSPGGGLADMLLVFEVETTQLRFALHTAIATGASDLDAAETGPARIVSRSMTNPDSFPTYADSETVLLAPQELIISDTRTAKYIRRIPFEDVRGFIPNFGAGRRPAA